MIRIAFYNLGCKVNQFDAAAMESGLHADDRYAVVPFHEEADIYVVNTCTVTGKSDHEARQAIRRAVRKNKQAHVVVTGCYAQTNPEEVARIEGVSLVLGNLEKVDLKEKLKILESGSTKVLVGEIRSASQLVQPEISGLPFKTRAFLKVQDGCNLQCSFCIIPQARGRSRSLPVDRVVEQVKILEGEGYQEIILTGIHLGSYGRDLETRTSLTALLEELLRQTTVPRIRISSVEPREVTDDLIGLMAGSPRICRHLHIPLQSGDDRILRRMNRNYTASFYEERIRTAAERIPLLGLGADIMVGFPGEREEHFEATRALIERLPFTYLHVFPYSPREGTAAATFPDPLTRSEKERRGEALRLLSEKKKVEFMECFIGKIVQVLLEVPDDPVKGWEGYTEHYIRVFVRPDPGGGEELAPNRLISVAIDQVRPEGGVEGVWIRSPRQRPLLQVR